MDRAYDTWVSVSIGSLVLAVCWSVLWATAAIRLRRNDIADVAWGLAFPTFALLLGGGIAALDPDAEPRGALVLLLVTLWGLRLSLHILRRVISHSEEDKRYAAWRAKWGDRWRSRSFLVVFLPQALLTALIAQPVLIAVEVHDSHSTLGWLDVVAAAAVVGGTLLEATADRQLRRFLARRAAGKEERRYLTTGVWSWSRHPNYAGDSITWIGFGLFGIAGALDAGAPWLIVPSVIGPVVMWWFLRFGSGVPLTERGREGHPEWDAYVERTSAFFPRPPRRTAG